VVVTPSVPTVVITPKAVAAVNKNTITSSEYADHMALSIAQLETVSLMLQILDQSDGEPAPTE